MDSGLQRQRTIPAGEMDEVNDVAEKSSGDLLIAAKNGLYHATASGKLDVTSAITNVAVS